MKSNIFYITFLSPSAAFVPGERTGTFRLGKDQLLTNENGSSISFEDYAVALVNEIEAPTHVKQRLHRRLLIQARDAGIIAVSASSSQNWMPAWLKWDRDEPAARERVPLLLRRHGHLETFPA